MIESASSDVAICFVKFYSDGETHQQQSNKLTEFFNKWGEYSSALNLSSIGKYSWFSTRWPRVSLSLWGDLSSGDQ